MKKLTQAQEKVISRLNDGWELGWSQTMASRRAVWLQKGGVGRGGESETVSVATATILLREGVIECERREFPVTKYRLAKAFQAPPPSLPNE